MLKVKCFFLIMLVFFFFFFFFFLIFFFTFFTSIDQSFCDDKKSESFLQ